MKVNSIHPIKKSNVALPIYLESIKAGFPSPADDFIDKKLDLNDLLIKHPVATFFVRVSGDSMLGAGIHTGDILVVDRALEAVNANIVVAVINGELTVKRLRMARGKVTLMPENIHYKPIEITENDDFSIWGVVTSVIHRV